MVINVNNVEVGKTKEEQMVLLKNVGSNNAKYILEECHSKEENGEYMSKEDKE